tara:strand:- start:817 stop:2103 length:1287 start_codon:yes stop_codon:yes gene_type:complete
MTGRDIMSKGILGLMRMSPFYSTIIVKQKIIETEEVDAAMATDGSTLLYNPKYISSLKNKEIVEILRHEAMHVANKHHIRCKQLRPKYERKFKDMDVSFHKAFNVAADLAINSLLEKYEPYEWRRSEFLKSGCIPGVPPFEKYKPLLSAEDYLSQLDHELSEKDEDERQEMINALDLSNDLDCSLKECEGSIEQAEAETNSNIASASINSKGSGAEKSHTAKAFIEKYTAPPKVNWKREMERFIQVTTKGRPNYRRPCRRHVESQFIMPSRKDKTVNEIIFLVDVSGSMSNEAVSSVYDHINDMVKYKENLTVTLLPFDDEVFINDVKTFNKSNLPIADKDRERTSYGGTLYTDAVIEADKRNSNGIIMLTDLMPADPDKFMKLKITSPFLMLSTYAAEWGHNDPEYCKRKREEFKPHRVIEVEVTNE